MQKSKYCVHAINVEILLVASGLGRVQYLVSHLTWPCDNPGYLTLKVYFMKKAPENNESQILEWMSEWSKCCGVKFQKTVYIDDSHIRITFDGGMLLHGRVRIYELEGQASLQNELHLWYKVHMHLFVTIQKKTMHNVLEPNLRYRPI